MYKSLNPKVCVRIMLQSNKIGIVCLQGSVGTAVAEATTAATMAARTEEAAAAAAAPTGGTRRALAPTIAPPHATQHPTTLVNLIVFVY